MAPSSPKPDYGTDLGPAFQARPRALTRVGAVSRGSVAPGRAVTAMRMQDSILIDRLRTMGQLTDRQHKAASLLHRMFKLAGLMPWTVTKLPYAGGGGDDDDMGDMAIMMPGGGADPLALEDDETYADLYRRHLRSLPGRQAEFLDALMLDQHPGIKYLPFVQQALDTLADRWGYAGVNEKKAHGREK